MSNDPHDIEADRFADKCRDLNQNAQRLDTFTDDVNDLFVKVWPCETRSDNTLLSSCEIQIELDGRWPIESFAQQLQELADKARMMATKDSEKLNAPKGGE